MMIDINKKYKTREGCSVVIHTVNAMGEDKVIGQFKKNGSWFTEAWDKQGNFIDKLNQSDYDLFECELWEGWQNGDIIEFNDRELFYYKGDGKLQDSKSSDEEINMLDNGFCDYVNISKALRDAD